MGNAYPACCWVGLANHRRDSIGQLTMEGIGMDSRQEYNNDGEQWEQDEARELAYELLTQMEWEQEECPREELPPPTEHRFWRYDFGDELEEGDMQSQPILSLRTFTNSF
jgi:hypothetical protein